MKNRPCLRIGAVKLMLRQHPRVCVVVYALEPLGTEVRVVPRQHAPRNPAAEDIDTALVSLASALYWKQLWKNFSVLKNQASTCFIDTVE